MNDKHYLSELPREDIVKMLSYPSDLRDDIYDIVAEDNGYYVSELSDIILGKDWHKWVKCDSCSYTWWMNIMPGHYAETLDITEYDYFSEKDAKDIKEYQKLIRELKDKIENLDGDDLEYYDKIAEWEDKADKLADEILDIVERELKQCEEVTEEQIVETFIANEMGNDYYYLGDDKTTVYRDYTKSYKTNYKEGE